MIPFSRFSSNEIKIKKYISFEIEENIPPINNPRAEFYLEYFKNLSPQGFELSLDGDSISIKISNSQ